MRDEPEGRPRAIGAMRLSTAVDRDEERAIAALHAAFDAGVTLVDTADAYAWDDREIGHNERLIARAVASWQGERGRVRVATKGGLVRPGGRWVPDGRARHLRAACAASRRALGVQRLDLYQLHVPDPRVPLATSLRALAALARDGAIGGIGLANVTVRQLESALAIAPIASVQVELSPWRDEPLRSGLVARCEQEGIRLLAYRPFGGVRGQRRLLADPVLATIAERRGATAWEVVLAWLRLLSPVIVPLPGPTRPQTARSAAHACALGLDAADRDALEGRFPAARLLRRCDPATPDVPAPHRRAATSRGAEVVLIVGLPGAGKSTLARELVAAGYARLNRDERGGRLADLLPALDTHLAAGRPVVMDNTYATRALRQRVLEVAARHRIPVRCRWLTTSLEEAQRNVVTRMLERHGRLLEPAELTAAARLDPGVLGPDVLFRYRRSFEPPADDEGFAAIEAVPFVRCAPEAHTSGRRCLLLWLDGVVRRSRTGGRAPGSADDVEILPAAAAILARHHAAGWLLAGLAWHPEVASGVSCRQAVAAVGERTVGLLGVPLEVLVCPHGDGPARCWCRKPLPGLALELLHRHQLRTDDVVYVGRDGLDRSYAIRLGLAYRHADELAADGGLANERDPG